jgi:hypothetical protein
MIAICSPGTKPEPEIQHAKPVELALQGKANVGFWRWFEPLEALLRKLRIVP